MHATQMHVCRRMCNIWQNLDDDRSMSVSSAAEQQQYLRHLPRFQQSVSNHCQLTSALVIDCNSQHAAAAAAAAGAGGSRWQQVAKPWDRQSHPITIRYS